MASAIGDVIDKLTEFVEVKTEQVKLMVLSRVSSLLSGTIALSILILLGFFFVFFLSFALANIFNDLLRSSYLGFFIIAGFYLLIMVIILILSKRGIIKKWIDASILTLSEKDEEEIN